MTPWTIAHQAPLSLGFLRQESWSGLPLPSPGYLPDPEIKPTSPALQADSLPLSYQGSSKQLSSNKNWLKTKVSPHHQQADEARAGIKPDVYWEWLWMPSQQHTVQFWKKATLEQLKHLKTTVYKLRFMGSQTVRNDWVTELNWLLKKKLGQQGTDSIINPKSDSPYHPNSPGAHAGQRSLPKQLRVPEQPWSRAESVQLLPALVWPHALGWQPLLKHSVELRGAAGAPSLGRQLLGFSSGSSPSWQSLRQIRRLRSCSTALWGHLCR